MGGGKTEATDFLTKEQLAYWEKYEPVNNMGKFARQVKIDSIKNQIDKIEK